MGFLDKVKEKASEAIEQGKDVAQGQQLKLQLKKLEGEEEEALSAFGNAAFTLYEAGTLSMSSDLAAAAERIRTRARGDRGQEGRGERGGRGSRGRSTNGSEADTASCRLARAGLAARLARRGHAQDPSHLVRVRALGR